MFSDSFLKSNPPILWRIAPLADFIVTVGVSGAGLGGPRDSGWLTLPLSEKSSLTELSNSLAPSPWSTRVLRPWRSPHIPRMALADFGLLLADGKAMGSVSLLGKGYPG